MITMSPCQLLYFRSLYLIDLKHSILILVYHHTLLFSELKVLIEISS